MALNNRHVVLSHSSVDCPGSAGQFCCWPFWGLSCSWSQKTAGTGCNWRLLPAPCSPSLSTPWGEVDGFLQMAQSSQEQAFRCWLGCGHQKAWLSWTSKMANSWCWLLLGLSCQSDYTWDSPMAACFLKSKQVSKGNRWKDAWRFLT